MFFFLVPRRYRPLFLLVMGGVWLVLGIAVLGRISSVVGCLFIGLGAVMGIRRRRVEADDDLDRYPGR
jgi:hypothetical protein